MRVAALADVHGNAPALAAVLEEVEREAPDLVVFCGDLTWGSLPQETLALVRGLEIPARFVSGNADRALLELRNGEVESPTDRERWMLAQHLEEDLALLGTFEPTVLVEVDGVGATCFSHGSPRSDEECVTERTPPERVREFMEGVDASVVVTAHVHVSYERTVAGVRRSGPGASGSRARAGRAQAPTGLCSARMSSCAGRSTTSRRPSHACARRTIHARTRSRR